MASGDATSHRAAVEATTCPDCGRLCPAGAAEYHPHVFCRVWKETQYNPWGRMKPITIHEMARFPTLKGTLEKRCRALLRAAYKTEVKLP